MIREPDPHNAFGVIQEVTDDFHYTVTLLSGQRIEVYYRRTERVPEFVQGDGVYLERANQAWVIASEAFGDALGGGGPGGNRFFRLDAGPGFDQGHFAP